MTQHLKTLAPTWVRLFLERTPFFWVAYENQKEKSTHFGGPTPYDRDDVTVTPAQVKLWDLETGELARSIECPLVAGRFAPIRRRGLPRVKGKAIGCFSTQGPNGFGDPSYFKKLEWCSMWIWSLSTVPA